MPLRRDKRIFSVGADAKTVKGERRRYLTGILYLAPNTLSGWQVCSHATPGCIAACLNTAGRGQYTAVQIARVKKTRELFTFHDEFLALVHWNIARVIRLARQRRMTPVIRLNGTSDLPWERFRYQGHTMMEHFPHIQFYDYTKHPARMAAFLRRTRWPRNYFLTFSRSETNDKACRFLLRQRGTVAVVFAIPRTQPLPTHWRGQRVVDGDQDDLRFLDPPGVIVGLRAKGRARQDTTGFNTQAA